MIADRHAPCQQPYGTANEQMLGKVGYEGAYPTRERAGAAVRLARTDFASTSHHGGG